jgi:uncharacterized membrane protein YdcZ (DUF606 family)
MRLRSRRRNLVVLSTHAIPASKFGVHESIRLARRRRFRFIRTGALLTVIGVMRLAQIMRCRWRVSLGLSGALLDVFGLTLFPGPARSAADLLGLVMILFALLKSTGPDSDRQAVIPQIAWRPPG